MKHWVLKIVIITFIISAGFSVVAEVFVSDMALPAAIAILALLIAVGIIFDIIGVAVATCDETPLVAMSAKRIKSAARALQLLKNADMVANICNDVVGDVCGIVSGSAGAAIALRIFMLNPTASELVISILLSSVIAAATVGGKAQGKKYAMKNNKKIVIFVGNVMDFFRFGRKDEKKS